VRAEAASKSDSDSDIVEAITNEMADFVAVRIIFFYPRSNQFFFNIKIKCRMRDKKCELWN